MSLTKSFTPRYPFPRCVRVKPFRALALNSVGLSNPGLGALLQEGIWQKRTKPFFISLMSLSNTPDERINELRMMIEMVRLCKKSFSSGFGIQVNLSCPNTNHDPKQLIKESEKIISVAGTLGVPVMPKYSISSTPIEAILNLNDHPDCDAICVSNTIPFGWDGINWEKTWGSPHSPLSHLGGGGLSGYTLLPLVCEWIKKLRDAGFTKPIHGGGGILSRLDVERYYRAGASSIFL